jgi:hypothetical protein
MTTDFVQQELAKIAAQKAAKAAASSHEPAAPPPPETAAPPTAPTAPEPPGRPADCSPADWAAMPEEVRALVAAGAGGQAVPVNPPEASAGLVASATEKVDALVTTNTTLDVLPEKSRRTRKPKDPPPPPVDLTPVVEAINANTTAIRELTAAVLGAAQILAG